MNGEDWLLEKLKWHGLDVYTTQFQFASLRDRLAHCIRENGYKCVIAGRREKRPETFGEVFQRVYGVKVDDVPRVTNTKQAAR